MGKRLLGTGLVAFLLTIILISYGIYKGSIFPKSATLNDLRRGVDSLFQGAYRINLFGYRDLYRFSTKKPTWETGRIETRTISTTQGIKILWEFRGVVKDWDHIQKLLKIDSYLGKEITLDVSDATNIIGFPEEGSDKFKTLTATSSASESRNAYCPNDLVLVSLDQEISLGESVNKIYKPVVVIVEKRVCDL